MIVSAMISPSLVTGTGLKTEMHGASCFTLLEENGEANNGTFTRTATRWI